MNPCELVSSITALAVVMAKGKTTDEIAQLAVIFSQLGDTLATLAFQQGLCCPPASPGPDFSPPVAGKVPEQDTGLS